jgi:hypothetical protein
MPCASDLDGSGASWLLERDIPMDAQSLADAIEQTQAALRSCDKLLQHVAAVAAQGAGISEAQSDAAASIIKVVHHQGRSRTAGA